jgi:hypothetical protein
MAQIVLERNTNLSPEKTMAKAKKTFIDKHRLSLEEESSCCLRFTGSGGFVDITVREEDNQTMVEIKSSEWAEIAKKFIKKL